MRTLDLGEAVGPGVPTGGTANQVLVKNGATNFDTSWKDASQLPAIGDEAIAREAADAALADGLAIIANGDTHAAVAAGQAVFVRSHSTLAPGLYWASSAIGTNATLSTSNLTADSQGGLNKLKGDIDSLNSNFNIFNMTTNGLVFSSNITYRAGGYCKIGNIVVVQLRLATNADITGTGTATLVTGLPHTLSYVDTTLSDETLSAGIWPIYTNADPSLKIRPYVSGGGLLSISGNRESIPANTIIGIAGVYLAH